LFDFSGGGWPGQGGVDSFRCNDSRPGTPFDSGMQEAFARTFTLRPTACPAMPFPRRFATFVWCLTLYMVWGLGLPGAWSFAEDLRETPIVVAIRKARPAVVNIRGEKTLVTAAGASGTRPDASRRVNGMGTGVIIDERGYIITNHHVVDGVREIEVNLYDGSRYTAKLIARDSETDLAIIKIDADRPLQTIQIGTSFDLMVGESVIALGNAYGYEHTATRGIVSALHRAVQVSDSQFYEDLIQTDASINPGNSGGPLLNINGEMVGINVAVRAGAQGIGFAIPVDRAVQAAARLLAEINQKNLMLGLRFASASGIGARLSVTEVFPDLPAAKAGLRMGDVIVSVGGRPVANELDFQRALLERQPGESLEFAVLRPEGAEAKLTVVLSGPADGDPTDAVWEVVGLRLESIPSDEFLSKYRTRYRGGLLITDVRSGSPAAAQGLRPGDVLVGMHLWETVSLENVQYIIQRPDFESFLPLKFFILRDNETFYGYLAIARTSSEK